MELEPLYQDAVGLLQRLISIPSYSKSEDGTAAAIEEFLIKKGVDPQRIHNNVWCINKYFDPAKPSIILNSHHDTVKPNLQYTNDPFTPIIKNGKLFGLGSNDAGGCLVSLLAAFLFFYERSNLKHNLIIAATAEEEISGTNGIEALLKDQYFQHVTGDSCKLPFASGWAAIVGEPTNMNLAIAEKGLMVLDCVSLGRAGHAAREEGENAIYKAMKDIEWFRTYRFSRVSEWLGPVKMTVTVIHTENKAHNIVPSCCSFVADIRITELYTHGEVLETIKQNTQCDIIPRSMRLRSTSIDVNHAIVRAGISLGKKCYGSPTSSDKALMPFEALKCGPGDSTRSHVADEFIYLHEIKEGIEVYVQMLEKVL